MANSSSTWKRTSRWTGVAPAVCAPKRKTACQRSCGTCRVSVDRSVWWSKRRWRCPLGECPARTWTETNEHVTPRLSITERAGVEACRLVGEQARSVASVAKEFGVTWATVMGSVRRHGQPLIDDPERVGVVTGLGIDETSFLKANAQHHIKLVTGFVVAWTRRDAGCRTRPSDIAAAKTIRCTGYGGSCSPVPNDSTSTARQGSCWACAR